MGRPKGDGETPKHNIRVAKQLWAEAKAEAKADGGRTITDVIVKSLQRYVTERQAKRRAQRPIPLTDDTAALADHPSRPVFPARTAQLRTFITPDHKMVMLDSHEVSGLLRALGASYRAPAYAGIAHDLDQLAEALDTQALQALAEATE